MDSLESNGEQDGLENGLKVSESHSLEESYSISDVESLLSAPNTDEHSLESLRFENTRLRLACTQLLNENYIAGQHGLDLLEEKENIRKSFDSLQKENDQLKSELTLTQQSLNQKIHAERQIRAISQDDEDAFEREKQERESILSENVNQLKFDLKKSQETVYTLQQEVERLSTRERELCDKHKGSELDRVELKTALKSLKDREKKLNQELLGLEDENVTLQQQVSHLRMRQIENDRLTGERDRLDEKCVELTKENEELSQMKETFKTYYEKAIEALNSEKELKKNYLVELEKVKQVQSIQYVPYQDRSGAENMSFEEDSIHSDLESLLNNQNNVSGDFDPMSLGVTSLQDELKQLDPNIGEKIDLNRFGMNGNEQDDSGSSVGTPLSTPRHSRVPSVSVGAPTPDPASPSSSPHKSISINVASEDQLLLQPSHHSEQQLTPTGESGSEDIESLRRRNYQLQQEVNQLRTSIINSGLEDTENNSVDSSSLAGDKSNDFESALKQEFEGLKTQLIQTKDKLKDCERRLGGMEDEHRAVVSCGYATLDEVAAFSAELTNLQQLVSPPGYERSMSSDQEQKGEDGSKIIKSALKKSLQEKLDELISTLQSEQFRDKSKFDTEFPIELISLVQKQLRELKRSCQSSLSQPHENRSAVNGSQKLSESKPSKEDTKSEVSEASETQTDLAPQVERLKLELTKKREQITSLRAVLKANKHTAEVAMTTVKGRYEQEKQIIVETVNKLKNELKKLKSDSATFAYIRSILVTRVDSLTNQIDDKTKENRGLNEKIQTLEQILRMSISQKLALTERLEALESGASPDTSTSSKSPNGSQKTAIRGLNRGFNTSNLGNPKSHIPQRYAKNPRASDASYLKKAFLQNK